MGVFSSAPRIVSKEQVMESLEKQGTYQALLNLF